MQNYSKTKQANDDKIEAIKNKLNASNIIRNDFFSHSYYKPQNTNSFYNNPIRQDHHAKPTLHTASYDNLKDRVHKEVNRGLLLETEKKELEWMLEECLENQNRIRAEFHKETENVNGHIDHLDHIAEDLQREIENNGEQANKAEGKNNELEAEINELADQNKILKNELRRLGDKTNEKMTEMQGKMQHVLDDYEGLKGKHAAELERLNQIQGEKIKRLEDDFTKKTTNLNDKYNALLVNKQNAESELFRLQDARKRAETELENKIKAIKEQFYEDEFNQFKGIVKIHNNRLRTARGNKDQLAERQDKLARDHADLEQEVQDGENNLNLENRALTEDITNLKEDVSNLQKEIEEHRTEEFNVESETQRLASEVQKAKFQFKQVAESGKYRIREVVDKYRYEVEETANKVEHAKMKTKELSEELERLRAQHRAQEKQNQRMIDNMRSKLNNNIFNTINEYKGVNASYNDGRDGRMQRSHMSQFM